MCRLSGDVPHRRKFGGIAAGTERRRSEMELSKMFGVERDVDFKVKGYESLFKVILNAWGEERLVFKYPSVTEWELVQQGMLCSVIFAAPAGIIHLPPPLTDEQRVVLMSLFSMGARYMGMTPEGRKRCFVNKPRKDLNRWPSGDTQMLTIASGMAKCLDSLVVVSDPEPFDIGKALGVEGC